MIKNILTIDIEDPNHSRLNDISLNNEVPLDTDTIKKSVCELLDLLDKYSQQATFFVLGVVAKALPQLIRIIVEKGHEVSSHGYYHRLVYQLTPEEFRKDLLQSIRTLEDIAGKSILGYRAPYWSITSNSLWALEIIKKCGLQYDSSISPSVNFLYGIRGSPRIPHFRKEGLWEIPPTTVRFLGKTVIVGGGIYLRAMPYMFTEKYISAVNRNGRYCLIYAHPHELVNYSFKKKLSVKENFILNFRKNTFRDKFLNLLNDFKFVTVKTALGI